MEATWAVSQNSGTLIDARSREVILSPSHGLVGGL